MPNVLLTAPMQEYVRRQIASGAYANLSEVVRAGVRLLMEKDGPRFDAFKADVQSARAEVPAGEHEVFDFNAERRQQAVDGLRAMMKTGAPVSDAELKQLREYGRR
jgi:antitoxin ParD1/3/4